MFSSVFVNDNTRIKLYRIVQYISSMTILILNRSIADNYILNISNKESVFENYEVIKLLSRVINVFIGFDHARNIQRMIPYLFT